MLSVVRFNFLGTCYCQMGHTASSSSLSTTTWASSLPVWVALSPLPLPRRALPHLCPQALFSPELCTCPACSAAMGGRAPAWIPQGVWSPPRQCRGLDQLHPITSTHTDHPHRSGLQILARLLMAMKNGSHSCHKGMVHP